MTLINGVLHATDTHSRWWLLGCIDDHRKCGCWKSILNVGKLLRCVSMNTKEKLIVIWLDQIRCCAVDSTVTDPDLLIEGLWPAVLKQIKPSDYRLMPREQLSTPIHLISKCNFTEHWTGSRSKRVNYVLIDDANIMNWKYFSYLRGFCNKTSFIPLLFSSWMFYG